MNRTNKPRSPIPFPGAQREGPSLLVKGGQGRSAYETERAANVVVAACIGGVTLLAVLGAVQAVRWILQ